MSRVSVEGRIYQVIKKSLYMYLRFMDAGVYISDVFADGKES